MMRNAGSDHAIRFKKAPGLRSFIAVKQPSSKVICHAPHRPLGIGSKRNVARSGSIPEVLDSLIAEARAPMILVALAGAFLAGLARGFSGFGSGLIFMPIASSALGPKVAVASLLVFDFLVAGLPVIRNFDAARARSLLPVAISISAFIPVGGWVAAQGDPETIRWSLSFVVFTALGLITAGLKWHGRETFLVAALIGSLSGFLGGLAALSGIVVVIYWLARDITPSELRANMFTLALLTTMVTALTYALNGMLTAHVFRVAILLLIPYLAGAWIGSSVFHLASPQTFRKIVYVMIFMSGVIGLPVFDSFLGR